MHYSQPVLRAAEKECDWGGGGGLLPDSYFK